MSSATPQWGSALFVAALNALFLWLRMALLVTAAASVAYAVVSWPSYLNDCRWQYTAAQQFIKKNCGGIEEMNALNTIEQCTWSLMTVRGPTPYQCAWLKMISTLGGCGKAGCLDMWRQTATTFTLLFASFITALLAAAWILKRGQNVCRASIDAVSMLPQHKVACE